MQILLTETKAKETTLQKKLIEKRNLFGLGLTSLIAACSADGAGGDTGDGGGGMMPVKNGPVTLPFEAKALAAAQANGYSADKIAGILTVGVEKEGIIQATLSFPDGNYRNTEADIYQLTTTLSQYDLVISVPEIDKNETTGDTSVSNLDYFKGKIFIYWDVATVISASEPDLEIKGNTRNDRIGINPPKFLQIGGAGNNYDMVIRSEWVDKSGGDGTSNEGAIYILWDVADYKTTTTITLDGSDTNIKDSGLLTIIGAIAGDKIGTHAPDFLQIGGVAGDNKLDIVIRSNAADGTNGAIYILWDVDNYSGNKTGSKIPVITLNNGGGVVESGLLTIKGAETGDRIGSYAPDFLQIGGVAGDNYDMVIRSETVGAVNKGAIYILWDVEEYAGENIGIALNGSETNIKDSGLLTIKGTGNEDNIGTRAPDFLQIGGVTGEEKLDMVIRSHLVNKPDGDDMTMYEGAIYILWDVDNYSGSKTATITLSSAAGVNNGSGLLTIYGAQPGDKIGTHVPDFLQLGGVAGEKKLDMVIRSHDVSKSGGNAAHNQGAIYILWNVADYAGKNKTIDLGKLGDTDPASPLPLGQGATAGSLAIHGAKLIDQIGTYAPEFLQIGGKDNNYDMVIRSEWVDTPIAPLNYHDNQGAIYILWDVNDYYSAGSNKNIDIDLATASSGLLTIYGYNDPTDANLGSNDNNILYGSDDDGNKILTNIDGDDPATKDIAFRDKDYTYILFGNKIADVVNDKVTSKTIDLDQVGRVFERNSNETGAGFFEYDGNGTPTNILDDDVTIPADNADATGYRFAKGTGSDGGLGYTTLAEVQEAYDLANPSSLSDADADLGVWDIA